MRVCGKRLWVLSRDCLPWYNKTRIFAHNLWNMRLISNPPGCWCRAWKVKEKLGVTFVALAPGPSAECSWECVLVVCIKKYSRILKGELEGNKSERQSMKINPWFGSMEDGANSIKLLALDGSSCTFQPWRIQFLAIRNGVEARQGRGGGSWKCKKNKTQWPLEVTLKKCAKALRKRNPVVMASST